MNAEGDAAGANSRTGTAAWLPSLWQTPAHAALRLYCLPYAGGAAALFRTWPAHLDRRIALRPVELPGHGQRVAERPVGELAPLAKQACEALMEDIDGPFALFGHSMGGLLAFEIARGLQARGRRAVHLFVSAHRAPHLPDPDPTTHLLDEEAFKEHLRQMDGMNPEALREPELMQLFIPILRADFAVCETYRFRPGPALQCPLTVFGGDSDDEVSAADLQAWRSHTAGRFRLQMFAGGHFFIKRRREELLRAITADLAAQFP